MTFAAGLAAEGMKPVVAIYSTFLQRGYDQLIHDVAIQNLPVLFALDRGGLVGADGATHHGAFDLSYLRCIPNIAVIAPSDENECRRLLTTAFQHHGPAAVRYPRGAGIGAPVERDLRGLPFGKAEVRRESSARAGARIAILAFGPVLHPALAAAAKFDATVVDMRFVKPLDLESIERIARTHDALVTVEENAVKGGAGSGCAEALAEMGIVKPILHLGLPDVYLEHGSREEVLSMAGLDLPGIRRAIHARFPQLSVASVG